MTTRFVRRVRALDRQTWWVIIAVFGAALIVRAAYIVFVTSNDTVTGDQIYYSAQARMNALGHWFEQPFTDHAPGADHPPLTSVVLTPVTWVFRNGSFVAAQRWFTAGVGLVDVGLLAALGRRVGGQRVGLMAAAFAAVYAGFWMSDGSVVSEPYAIAGVLCFLLAVLRVRDEPTMTRAVVAGALGGITMLARAEMALLVPLVYVPVVWLRVRPIGRAAAVRLVLVGIGTTAAVVAPWVGFNATRFEERVIVSSNDGLSLLGSNCDETYYGDGIGTWDLRCALAAEIPAGFDSSQASKLRTDLAVAYARNHLGRLPIVALARLGRLWMVYDPGHEIRTGPVEGRPEWAMWIGVLQYWAFVGLALLGLGKIGRADRWILLAVPLVASIAGVLITAHWRIRVTADITVVVAAAAGFAGLTSRDAAPAPMDEHG